MVNILAQKTDRKPSPRKRAGKPDDADVGRALRSVYQQAVEEQIPDEFLDLLGKLD